MGVNIEEKSSNGVSFGGHCVLEVDRIPLLKGHEQALEQALEQKHCFSGIFSDDCDASANLLNKLMAKLFHEPQLLLLLLLL